MPEKENNQDLIGNDQSMSENNSAFILNNPDFDPSKDVPQARGCDTMFDIISNNN
jgi:hypothetical protein